LWIDGARKLSFSLRKTALDIQRAIWPLWEVSKLGTTLLVRYFFRRPSQHDYPKRIRQALERLGITYLKLGQYLAMRRDLLSEELCRELGQLYEAVSPLDFHEIRAVVEAELHGPLTQFFPVFDRNPVAAASVAQVHEARTRANERVAVKIQRPGIRQIFAADIRNLRRVAALADALGLVKMLSLEEVVVEFAKWTSREFDFLTEGRTADRLRQNATAHEVVPVIYWELTTPKVLTMQFIDGMSLAQIISLVRQGREDDVLARLPNLDLDQSGHHMADASLRQFFVHGFFHGDPHPGNVLILSNNSVAFVDFGIFGVLSEYHREILTGYIESLAVGNINEAFRYFSKLSTPTEQTDFRAFEQETMVSIRRWYEASKSPASTITDRQMGKYFGEMLGAVRRNHLRMGLDTLLFWRALSALDYSALSMSSHFDMLYELRIFFEQIRPGPVERLLKVITDRRFVADVAGLTPRMPDYLNSILMSLLDRDLSRLLVVQESVDDRHSELKATRCLVAALVGVSLTVVGLGSHLGLTLLVVVLSFAALLFTFSLAEARTT
jgi:ubiquinone biosynthesis protein